MTAVLEPTAITSASVERTMRDQTMGRNNKYFHLYECAATWVADLVRARGDRPAEAVLADITVICRALDEIDNEFFTCEGTG